MKKHIQAAGIMIAVLSMAFIFFLLVSALAGCGTVRKTLSSRQTDSVGVTYRDTSYTRRDSAGTSTLREIIREYYHDTTRTILQREIVREQGQTVYVKDNSGQASSKDTTAKTVDIIDSSKETAGTTPFQWLTLLTQLIPIALIIYLIKRK